MPEIEATLRDRFQKSIRKCFEQPPLIGPKWFRPYTGRRQADFEFIGVPKLAKAMGMKMQFVGTLVVKHLDLHGLDVKLDTTPDGRIFITVLPDGAVKEAE